MAKTVDSKSKATRKLLQAPTPTKKEATSTEGSKMATFKAKGKHVVVNTIKHGIHRMGSNAIDSTFSEDDVLGDVAKARQSFRKAEMTRYSVVQSGRFSWWISKAFAKGGYGLGNRTFNLVRGRGFTRTPEEFSIPHKARRRFQRVLDRVKASRLGRAGKGVKKGFNVLKFVSKPIRTIIVNPLATKSILLLAVIIVLIAAFLAGSSPMQQDEFALNRSWLNLTHTDRNKSTDKVDYWTNIEEILWYTNFVYEDYDQGDEWEDPADTLKRRQAEATPGGNADQYDRTMEELEEEIWSDLNDDPKNLKTMTDLYTAENSEWKLSGKDLKTYQTILDQAKEIGYYTAYQELDHFFASVGDKQAQDNALVITKRFGYVSEEKIYNGTTFQATQGQVIYAPMGGKVTIDGEDVIIKNDESEITFKRVTGIRYKTGDKVTSGQELGKVGGANSQEVYFKRLEEKATKDKKAVWTHVNPGFYLPKVTYNQTTSVITDLNISGDLATRSKSIYDYIKKKVPDATDNGIAAMLGNFATESNIEPKRAESDFAAPPVGAYEGAWDDENWLNMGFAEGASVGSLVLNRGLGLGQWTDTTDGSTRSTMLREFAKSKGKKWYDLELQLEFMLEGDSPYYREILMSILKSNEDVNTLTRRFLVNWEGNPGDKLKERQNNAQQIVGYLKGGNGIGPSGSLAASFSIPKGYEGKFDAPTSTAMTTQPGNHYPVGQCTWYVYNRLAETGRLKDLSGSYGFLGNGQDWVRSLGQKGWKTSMTPSVGAVVSTTGGFDFTYPAYGHVGYVEHVNPDGSFLVSECNYNGVQDKIHYRVCQPAGYYTFATQP